MYGGQTLYQRNCYAKKCEDALDTVVSERYGGIRNLSKYATFDWECATHQIELKTRYNNNIGDYPELTANDTKINGALKRPDKRTVFLYWFKNGDLYEWVFDPAVKLPRITNGDARLVDGIQERPHIPTYLLKLIGNYQLPRNNIEKISCLY
jgi:hypothetical protein